MTDQPLNQCSGARPSENFCAHGFPQTVVCFVPSQTIAPMCCDEEVCGRLFSHNGGKPEARPCTCHPDDNPPKACPQKFALSECRAAATK